MKSKKITLGLFAYYLLVLSWVILLKFQFSLNELDHMRSVNWIPFHESVIVNSQIGLDEIIQNAFAFIPFGIFMHTLWQKKPLRYQIIPIVLTSLAFELIQFIFAIGATDITDLITNSLGGIIGIGIALVLSKAMKNHWEKCINVIGLIGAILCSLFLAVLIFANL